MKASKLVPLQEVAVVTRLVLGDSGGLQQAFVDISFTVLLPARLPRHWAVGNMASLAVQACNMAEL